MVFGRALGSGLFLLFSVWPIPLAGQPMIQTVAGSGRSLRGAGGPGIDVALGRVPGLAVDAAGNVYASDLDYDVIMKISAADILTVYAGTGVGGALGQSYSGPATQANLDTPQALVFDQSGNLYIADADGAVILRIAPDGTISKVAGGGSQALNGGSAVNSFVWEPMGIAVDKAGNLYIAESANERVTKVDPSGIITTVAGTLDSAGFSGDGGPATAAQLNFPDGVAVDSAGDVYISDRNNNCIREVSTNGAIQTIAGGGNQIAFNGALATNIALSLPSALTFDSSGNLIFPDVYHQLILRLNKTTGQVSIIAGNGQKGFSGDGGPATSASLQEPMGIGFDPNGNLYFADQDNHRVRKIDTNGIITTIAGNGMSNYGGDGGPAVEALLDRPGAVAVSSTGDMYIADTNNNRVRKVDSFGTIVTVAGNGTAGYSGDGGPATQAELNLPGGVAVDGAGNLYISDTWNFRIRKVNPSGTITTIAGTGQCCYNGDGIAATSAQVNQPGRLRFDGQGNLYFADQWNQRIRKITPSGTISTVAGDGQQGFGGDGRSAVAASLNIPDGVAVAQDGSILIADLQNSRVRAVSPDGTINTISGNGNFGFTPSTTPANTDDEFPADVVQGLDGNIYFPVGTYQIARLNSAGLTTLNAPCCTPSFGGDGGPVSAAIMDFTSPGGGMGIDGNGDLYLADTNNDRIRKITLRSLQVSSQNLDFSWPSPAGSTAQLQITNNGEGVLQWTATANTEEGGSWLELPTSSGTAPSTITIAADATSLSPGVYTGSITVSSPSSVGSPATVKVTLNVAAISNCDINRDGATNISDVQLLIDQALGEAPAANRLTGDEDLDVVDVQIVIDAALGAGCEAD
ncbi:MAG TPA: SMP-30/gluconolactonase/LRE family protein [Bryobacteraceae bacterium]|nr:SMP-30/gluconolactonase/LRE family protein [Bryobacteraceae bacterium]